jgi:hypothetical protein
MSKDMWIEEHERIGDDYASGAIDLNEAVGRLKSLGFDQGEIDEQICALDLDRDNDGLAAESAVNTLPIPRNAYDITGITNFLTGASSRPTIAGRTSTEERLPAERRHFLPGCANDNGATAENAAPTSGDAK